MTITSTIYRLIRRAFMPVLPALACAAAATSCVDDSTPEGSNPVAVTHTLPAGVEGAVATEYTITFKELNSGRSTSWSSRGALPELLRLETGLYDIDGRMTAEVADPDGDGGATTTRQLRAIASSVAVAGSASITLDWFLSNLESTLVFSEIYVTGSPNATATGGLRDSYVRIYNNSDRTVYADGLALCESAFVNSRVNTYEILTPANDRDLNFTAGSIWVIPGSGTDHPIEPGGSLKLADQAINWGEQVSGALDHTDADFEWVDDNPQDTDNPRVPNLEKWYCYSLSIWMLANQANRSYALVRFPEGMTAESYLAAYHGPYDYISAIGSTMRNEKAYLIPNAWILDGVNLGNAETYVRGALGNQIDISYARISDVDKDPDRFGKRFERRTAATLPTGQTLLQDTNDSASDFRLVTIK